MSRSVWALYSAGLAIVLIAGLVGACRRAEPPPGTESAALAPASLAGATVDARPVVGPDGAASEVGAADHVPDAVPASASRVSATIARRMAEVQAIVDDGPDPTRLARLISGYAAEPDALVARKTALTILRTVPSRSARLAALIDAGAATPVAPEDDPLWPDLVGTLSETWAPENSAEGRRRMLREKDRRTRLLLVSSLARYAASNRGLSDLTMPQRRVLRGEFMRLFPGLPAQARAEVDAFRARFDVNARGTL